MVYVAALRFEQALTAEELVNIPLFMPSNLIVGLAFDVEKNESYRDGIEILKKRTSLRFHDFISYPRCSKELYDHLQFNKTVFAVINRESKLLDLCNRSDYKKKKYLVSIKELWTYSYSIKAKSEKEAIDIAENIVENNNVASIDRKYSHRLESKYWDVEEINGE